MPDNNENSLASIKLMLEESSKKTVELTKAKTEEITELIKKKNDFFDDSKGKIDSFFRQNELMAREAQILFKGYVNGDIDDTIKLFKICQTTLTQFSVDPSLMYIFYPWVGEVINAYKYYKEFEAKSHNANENMFEYTIRFKDAEAKMIDVFVKYLIDIGMFINEVLAGTIIMTRRIKASGYASNFEVADRVDGLSNDDGTIDVDDEGEDGDYV